MIVLNVVLIAVLLSLKGLFIAASLYSNNVEEEIKHVNTVNNNFKKLDESLRLVNENFVLLDAKTNDNSVKVNNLAAETRKAFTQMTTYFKNIQQQIDDLREEVQHINERFGNNTTEKSDCNGTTVSVSEN